jgi:negative regulator of sigma E activity
MRKGYGIAKPPRDPGKMYICPYKFWTLPGTSSGQASKEAGIGSFDGSIQCAERIMSKIDSDGLFVLSPNVHEFRPTATPSATWRTERSLVTTAMTPGPPST